MGFLEFIVKFAYAGIIIAFAGIVLFLRYRKYDDETGNKSTVPKAIGVGIFVLGAIWVISPFFIKLATGTL